MRHLSSKQYARAWLSILQTAKDKKKAGRGLVFNLYKNGRLNLLSAIIRELEELEARESGITPVLVKTAGECEHGFIENVVKKLMPGEKAAVTQKAQPSLLSGLVVETTNRRWRLNLRHKLDLLAKQLSL